MGTGLPTLHLPAMDLLGKIHKGVKLSNNLELARVILPGTRPYPSRDAFNTAGML